MKKYSIIHYLLHTRKFYSFIPFYYHIYIYVLYIIVSHNFSKLQVLNKYSILSITNIRKNLLFIISYPIRQKLILISVKALFINYKKTHFDRFR